MGIDEICVLLCSTLSPLGPIFLVFVIWGSTVRLGAWRRTLCRLRIFFGRRVEIDLRWRHYSAALDIFGSDKSAIVEHQNSKRIGELGGHNVSDIHCYFFFSTRRHKPGEGKSIDSSSVSWSTASSCAPIESCIARMTFLFLSPAEAVMQDKVHGSALSRINTSSGSND